MKKYRVLLNGRNFTMESNGELETLGFYTTRWVEAENPQEAELKAIDLVKSDSSLRMSIRNMADDPPMIYLEEISEIDSFDGVNEPGAGYTFYPDDKKIL